MLKERYYYGVDFKLGNATCILDSYGRNLACSKAKFTKPMSRITICGLWDTEKNTMAFGICICNPKDTFRREIGRQLSKERAINSPYTIVKITDNLSVSETFIYNAKRIENEALLNKIPIKLDGE